MNLASYITAYNKSNLRWSIGLYVKDIKMKLHEENRRYVFDLRVGTDFLNKIHKTLTKNPKPKSNQITPQNKQPDLKMGRGTE